MQKNLKNYGFTLIEIMIAMTVLVVLTGIIIGMVTQSGAKSQADLLKVKVFDGTTKNKLINNLIGEWSLDEGSGATAVNSSDYGATLNGTINGATYQPSSNCISNGCLSFDGNDTVSFANISSMDISNLSAYTISVWVRAANTANLEAALGYGSDINNNPTIVIGKASDNRAWFQNRDDAASIMQIYSDNTIDGNWHLLTGVRYSANDHKIFVDGVLQSMLGTTTIGTMTENKAGLGVLPRAANSYLWTGSMDEVRIYGAALAVSQIQEQYYAGLGKLLAKGEITQQEYNQRIAALEKQTAYK
ncbi:MAG: LamG-like jellyroll fold domain-containing protein [Candidatus Paceibacterota bacterium]